MNISEFRRTALILSLATTFGCQSPKSFTLGPQKHYIGSDFQLDLPKVGVRIEQLERDNLFALDFFVQSPPFSPLELYSFEWYALSKRKNLLDQQFHEWMNEFIPDYLTKNFGKGSYSLTLKKAGHHSSGNPSVTFAGYGKHNGGRKGSIYGMAVNYGHHLAIFYLLTEHKTPSSNIETRKFDDYTDFDKFLKFTNGLRCTKLS